MSYNLNNGDVIIFPTDTVYGIGCKLYDFKAIKKIFDIKKRDTNKKLAVLISSLDQVRDIIEISNNLLKLSKAFWPGALTIIVPLKVDIPYYEKTIGLRIPNYKLALDILKENGAMATSSVNISGEKPLDTFKMIYENYNDVVKKIYKKSEESSSISSTVVILENDDYKIIREGQISEEDIKNVLKK